MIRRTIVIALSVIFLCAGMLSGQTHEDWRLERDFKSALRMMESSHYDTAIQFFDMVLKKDPQRSEAYYQRGIAKWRTNDEDGAMQDFDQAIEIEPGHAEAIWDRADLKKSRENFAGAIDDYTLYIKVTKDSDKSIVLYDAYNKRAAVKLKMDDTQGAGKDFRTATRLAPTNHVAYYQLGRLAFDDEEFGEAVQYFDKALEHNKGMALSRYYRGIAKYHLKDYYSALEDLKACQYTIGGQEKAAIYYYKGLAKIHKNFKTGGCKELKQALDLGFKEAEAAIEKYCR